MNVKLKKVYIDFIKRIFNRSGLVEYIVLLLLVILTARGWLNSGIPKGDDILAGFAPANAISQSIFKFHTLPVYSDYWYLGSPIYTVFNHLLWSIEMVFVGILGSIAGLKVLFILLFWLSGVFMYLFVRNLTGNRAAGFIASILYIFNGFSLVEFIFTGHAHLLLSFMLAPCLFWSLERVLKRRSKLNVLFCAICIALLILSFPQAFPILVGPIFLIYLGLHFITSKQKIISGLKLIMIVLLIGLCLSAFWWLPLFFEKGIMYSVEYSKQDSLQWTATFWQAITLRPVSGSSQIIPSTSNPIYISILQMIGLVLSCLGLILNYKNKLAWFFAVMAVISIFLAIGLNSPMNLYGFCFDHLPLFNSVRTPARFLFITAFCFSILSGYFILAIKKYIKNGIKWVSILVIISIMIIGNIWVESQQAFQIFKLPSDKEQAFAWIKEQESGDYRITDLPFNTWDYNSETRYIINPMYWFYLHGKETVGGGIPSTETKNTSVLLETLNNDIMNHGSNLGEWLSVLNVKYVLLDKTNSLYSSIILGDGYERVWTSGDIEIYQNNNFKPRVFLLESPVDSRYIYLWDDDIIQISTPESTQEAVLSLSKEISSSSNTTLKCVYKFSSKSTDWVNLEAIVTSFKFQANDVIQLSFYSEYAQPSIELAFTLWEKDGSRYDAVIGRLDGIAAGWNNASYPLSLFELRYSTDENGFLDTDQIEKLWIRIQEKQAFDQSIEFGIYFDELSVVSQEINDQIEYIKINPGKYEVYINSDRPSTLVLAESYNAAWKTSYEGQHVHSKIIYEYFNSFYLPAGEYKVMLEFDISPVRKAANIVSVISFVIVCLFSFFILVKKIIIRRKRNINKQA